MTLRKQTAAARKNIKKAQKIWKGMTSRQHALAQPQGRGRAKPGATGEGAYFRIVVRPKDEFVTFRYHDVGKSGHIQRLAGKRQSGSWSTQAWLISKQDAHLSDHSLVADTADAHKILDALGSPPVHDKGDIFTASDRPNVPEYQKPTVAQKRARARNIKRAQETRWAYT